MSDDIPDNLQEAKDLPTAEIGIQINLLHDQIMSATQTTREALRRSLESAWRAGGLLEIARQRVKKEGNLGWGQWVEANFNGSYATAHRYIKLYGKVEDISILSAESLRQAYVLTGVIKTAPKASQDGEPDTLNIRCNPIPSVAMITNRFQRWNTQRRARNRSLTPFERQKLQEDFRDIYLFLRNEVFSAE